MTTLLTFGPEDFPDADTDSAPESHDEEPSGLETAEDHDPDQPEAAENPAERLEPEDVGFRPE